MSCSCTGRVGREGRRGSGTEPGLAAVAELGRMSAVMSSLRVTQSGGLSRVWFQEGEGGRGLGSPWAAPRGGGVQRRQLGGGFVP